MKKNIKNWSKFNESKSAAVENVLNELGIKFKMVTKGSGESVYSTHPKNGYTFEINDYWGIQVRVFFKGEEVKYNPGVNNLKSFLESYLLK